MKRCSRLFIFCCRNCQKTTNFGTLSHFDEVRGGVEPWLMARWKARVRLRIRHNCKFFSLALTVEALQGKTHQDSLLSGGGRSLGAKISGEGVFPGEYFFGFYKTRHFTIWQCKLHRATCRRFDTIPACDTRTDRQTEGIAVASTSLAMRPLRRAVKLITGSIQCHWIAQVPPFPQIDTIGTMVIVCRARRKIIWSVLCSIVCNNWTQWTAHTFEQT